MVCYIFKVCRQKLHANFLSAPAYLKYLHFEDWHQDGKRNLTASDRYGQFANTLIVSTNEQLRICDAASFSQQYTKEIIRLVCIFRMYKNLNKFLQTDKLDVVLIRK